MCPDVNPYNNGSSLPHKSCSDWINPRRVLDVFSSVCVLHVSPVVSLQRSCCFAFNKQNCPVFEPIPSFLCVHVDVEMTSVVELFSGRFGFSVKSGMWTGQRFLCRTLACAACARLIRAFTSLQIQGWYWCCLTASLNNLVCLGYCGLRTERLLFMLAFDSNNMSVFVIRRLAHITLL